MKIEIRADSVHIEGYVNAICRDSRPLEGSDGKYFVEQVDEGVFRRALQKNDVIPMHNHERSIEGCSNITMYEDSIGLYASFDTTDATIRTIAENKEFRGWSFGFSHAVSRWEERSEDMPRRHLTDFTLHEISLIDSEQIPAYKGTSVHVRSEDVSDSKEYRAMECRTDYELSEEEKSEETTPAPEDDKSNGGNIDLDASRNINVMVSILSL